MSQTVRRIQAAFRRLLSRIFSSDVHDAGSSEDAFFPFPVDVSSTTKHLRQDLRDDWFSDSLNYLDLIRDQKGLRKVLEEIMQEGNGNYVPGKKQTYDLPKASWGLRYCLETDFYDRFCYQAICSFLMPFIDPLISNRVFSHRYNKYINPKRYLFKHRIELWQTFEGLTRLGIEQDKCLLITDLYNYFEHISVDAIKKALASLLQRIDATDDERAQLNDAVESLIQLLEKWCFNDVFGLPQNRDPSSFLANIVLDAMDTSMIEQGFDYYRYVDDIRIVCADHRQARKALKILVRELRELGLNINTGKTDILTKSSPDLVETFPNYDDRVRAIDAMWKSRSKKVITRSIPILCQLLKETVDSGNTQGRRFRFCVNRFKVLIATGIFNAKSILAGDIADSLIQNLDSQPASTDQFCKLLADIDLTPTQINEIAGHLTNPDVAIYEWQNYHLWLLLAYRAYYDENLVIHAIEKCRVDVDVPQNPEVPACFLYLAAVGKRSEVEKLIPHFRSEWPYQHQRFFLIALQDSSKNVLKPLVPYLSRRLQGTISRIKGKPALCGNFVLKQDTTSITNVYDELSPYD